MFIHDGKIQHGYEIFKVKVVKAGTPMPGGGVVAEDYEQWPGDNAFGRTAWHCHSLKWVEKRFDEITNKALGIVEEPEIEDEETVETETQPTRGRGRPRAEIPTMTIPTVEFTVGDLAEANNVEYHIASMYVKENVGKLFKLNRTGRKEGTTRGKPSNFYVKI